MLLKSLHDCHILVAGVGVACSELCPVTVARGLSALLDQVSVVKPEE